MEGGGGFGDCWLDARAAVVGAGSSEGTGGCAGRNSGARKHTDGAKGSEGAMGVATSVGEVLASPVSGRSLLLLDFRRFFFGGSALSNCAA